MDPNQSTVRSMAELLVDADPDVDEVPETPQILSPENEKLKKISALKHVQLHDEPVFLRAPSIRSRMSTKKERKPRNRMLKIVVVIYFILIVVGISTTYYFMKRQKHIMHPGVRIDVDELSRVVKLHAPDNSDILTGRLGVGLDDSKGPFNCVENEDEKAHLCLRWKDQAQLRVDFEDKGDQMCYHLSWTAVHEDTSELKDCYLTDDEIEWYGLGIVNPQTWPLGKDLYPKTPFVTGTTRFGQVLKPYLVSSLGIAVNIDEKVPLHISIEEFKYTKMKHKKLLPPGGKYICLMADSSGPPFKEITNKSLELNYTICATNSPTWNKLSTLLIKNATSASSHRPDLSLLDKPMWSTGYLHQETNNQTVISTLQDFHNHGMDIGTVVFDHYWESEIGDLDFDPQRFSHLSSMFNTIGDLGVNVSLGVHPYISPQSKQWKSAMAKDLFVRDAGGVVPGLSYTHRGYKSSVAAVVDLDVTGTNYLHTHFNNLQKEHDVDLLFLGGDAESLPYDAVFKNREKLPNDYTKLYNNLAMRYDQRTQITSAFGSQQPEKFLVLPSQQSTWQSLQNVIPRYFTMGLLGYHYVIPDAIGGTGSPRLPSKELYIRWLELSAFLPVMHFLIPPFQYDNNTVHLTEVHVMHHKDLVQKVIAHELAKSPRMPVIRPVLSGGEQPHSWTDATQFLVGDKLMVAPVLEEGSRDRNVSFPEGVWHDPSNNRDIQGPTTLHYAVPLESIPFFFRKDI